MQNCAINVFASFKQFSHVLMDITQISKVIVLSQILRQEKCSVLDLTTIIHEKGL